MKADWQKVSFVLFGLIVGSGFTGGISYFQSVEASEGRAKIEASASNDRAIQNQILVEVGKLSTTVETLVTEVNRLRDKIEEGD